MGDEAAELPLEDAMQRWYAPALVAAHDTSLAAMAEAGQAPDFLYTLPSAREHPDPRIRAASRLQVAFGQARGALHRDFRSRLVRGQLAPTGVQTKPERHQAKTEISALWAADFNINPSAGVINCAGYRWVAVTVQVRPAGSEAADAARRAPPALPAGSASQVAALDDDTVLALFEEHAKRVVEGPDAKLVAPGKISLMPIVLRKMRHRAEQGELEPTLAAESAWLAAWIPQSPTESGTHQKHDPERDPERVRGRQGTIQCHDATMPR